MTTMIYPRAPASPTRISQTLHEHALGLLGGWLARAQKEGWLCFEQGDGGAIWPEEIELLFDRHSRQMAGPTLSLPVTLTPEACWQRFQARLEEALTGSDDRVAERWHDLITRLRLDRVEVQALALLVALHLDQALARAWRYAWANHMETAPSWGFLVRLLDGQATAAARLAPTGSALLRAGLITLYSAQPDVPLSEQTLTLAPEVMPVLLGWRFEPGALQGPEQLGDPPPRLADELKPRLRKLLETGRPLRAAVHGPQGSGRLAIAAQIARGAGTREGLWQLDLGRAVEQGRARELIAQARRVSALLDIAVVVRGLGRLGEQQRRWCESVDDAFEHVEAPLIWLLETAPPAHVRVEPAAMVGVGYPARDVRLETWRRALRDAGVEDARLSQLAGQYLLSEGQVEAVARRALASQGARPLFDALIEEAREASQLGIGRLATPETARVSLEQLIVSDETEAALTEVIHYAGNRHALMSQWGLGDRLSYGLGLTCLFSGPPGTGKTLAAQAIATALELELYRVDLSQLVSKYIGETEKHLGELFNAAEQGEVLLLFDEADSVFGRRTEVKTSVDRYANLEVNYLLQRIEHFNGTTILTTNFEAGIDEAFARRIRYKVSFGAPDEHARHRLWQALMPGPLLRADDVDLELLACHYELSGGHIKEVVLRAASLAMSHGLPVLTQDILIRSANVEYRKLGKLPVSLPPSPRRR